MRNSFIDASRRELFVGWGGAALATVVVGPQVAFAQLVPKHVAILTVGDVEMNGLIVRPINMGSPNLAMDKGLCKLLSGGIHFQATITLAPVIGAQPTWWGELFLVQHVQFRHEHTISRTGQRECASSAGQWDLDGQIPYLNKRVRCAKGKTSIDHADDPGTFVEDHKKGPFEEVDVRPHDRFRTYVVWETTDNSRPPTINNPSRRHVVARVDWNWSAVAIDPPSNSTGCASTSFRPNAWGAQAATSDVKVFLGKDALADPLFPKRPIMPPPGAKAPGAMPESWRSGGC